jgi:hypothetical protein
MTDADYYREQSEFCIHMADVVQDAEDKGRWLKLAQHDWQPLDDTRSELRPPPFSCHG